MPEPRQTREAVEIARVGPADLSTGPFTFTREHLASAVTNAQALTPRLGIGHVDPRFNGAKLDGEPAFGKVANLRLAEDGDVLLGDYTDVLPWLNGSLDVLYPGRSIEARVRGDDMEIRAVKLLGTEKPGIATLKDLEMAVAASAATGETSAEQLHVITQVIAAATTAGANLDDLRDAFQALHPMNQDGTDWWCVREIQINPDQLIVEHHGTGGEQSYRVAWTVQPDGSFTFGDLTEVAVQYVDITASSGAAVVYREPARRPTPTKEESSMDPKILRENLGLAEDSSDEDVTAKLAELNARPTEENVQEQVAAAAEAAKTEAIAASGSNGEIVKLDKQTFAELKASADRGAEAARKLDDQARDTFIAAAVGDGKFPPSRVEHYTKRYDTDPDGTRTEIDALQKGVIPVTEIGASTSTDDLDELVTTGLFPQLATQEA